jgi:hypothetical protein
MRHPQFFRNVDALSTIAKLPVADQPAVVDPSILRESAQVDIPQILLGILP